MILARLCFATAHYLRSEEASYHDNKAPHWQRPFRSPRHQKVLSRQIKISHFRFINMELISIQSPGRGLEFRVL